MRDKKIFNFKTYPLYIRYGIDGKEVSREKYIRFCERLESLYDWIPKEKPFIYKHDER